MAALLLVLLLGVGQAAPGADPPTAAVDHVAEVRTLYATAAFEGVLQYVAALDPSALTAEVEQYRALCLLALGRTPEAEASFAAMVALAPLHVIPETDVAPRVLTIYQRVRAEVLPAVARDRYTRARGSFDAGNHEAAAAQFRELMAVFDDPALASESDSFADLRQLADGFLRLSDAEVERAAVAAAAPAPAPDPVPPSTSIEPVVDAPPDTDEIVVTRIVVYSRDDADVSPPVEVSRFMPPWNPPSAMRLVEYRGTLEVVIDETGEVEQATMVRPTNPAYDLALLGATNEWRFLPARRGGEPVKYSLTFEVHLRPAS